MTVSTTSEIRTLPFFSAFTQSCKSRSGDGCVELFKLDVIVLLVVAGRLEDDGLLEDEGPSKSKGLEMFVGPLPREADRGERSS